MSNLYYDPGSARAQKVRALFDRIAPRYDLINDLQSFGLHRLWKKRVAKVAAVHPGCAALDVCCGTGDIARLLDQAGAQVTALDFSTSMLEVARRRSSGRTIEYVNGDAMRLNFPDASFDAVTMGYGLRNLSDWKAGLSEMKRVARPGGRIVVLEFGKPANAVWRKIYFAYLRLFVPILGTVFCADSAAYAYILESLQHYPAQEGVKAEMERLGLIRVRIVSFLGGVMSINLGVVKP